jgi:hypothetical protein
MYAPAYLNLSSQNAVDTYAYRVRKDRAPWADRKHADHFLWRRGQADRHLDPYRPICRDDRDGMHRRYLNRRSPRRSLEGHADNHRSCSRFSFGDRRVALMARALRVVEAAFCLIKSIGDARFDPEWTAGFAIDVG